MPAEVTVFVPIGMRPLTGGRRTVPASGATIAEIVADLEANFPGFHETLVEEGSLRRNLTIAVNSVEQPLGLLATVPEGAEVHILQAMAGGAVILDTGGK
ncbi:MAG: MoaD/ThiS family protein [Chloroflexota bacterium]|nr:MoaD/ThiS family protein [Chloroflexota bacterium]